MVFPFPCDDSDKPSILLYGEWSLAADLIESIRKDADGAEVPLSLLDLELHAGMQQGDEVDQDVTCDSQFMLDVIPSIGAAVQGEERNRCQRQRYG